MGREYDEKRWIETLNELKKYINDNNKRPSKSENDLEIKQLGG